MHTTQSSRRIDHIAIGIVAVMLGSLAIFFERLLAGSWRELGALLLAVAIVIAGAAAIDRVRRRRAASSALTPPWTIAALTVLGAAGGAAYGLVAAGHPVGHGAVSGALVLGVLGILGGARRARAAKKSLSPGQPAA